MKNYNAICTIVRNICRSCEKIETLSNSCIEANAQSDEELAYMYNEQLYGEVADIQQLVLKLTGKAMPEETEEIQSDEGSVFASGDLDDVINKEETDCGDKCDQ